MFHAGLNEITSSNGCLVASLSFSAFRVYIYILKNSFREMTLQLILEVVKLKGPKRSREHWVNHGMIEE